MTTFPYAWIIDKDLTGETDTIQDMDAVGIMGPRAAPGVLLDRLRSDPLYGVPFQLFDDDHTLYYEGRIAVADPTQGGMGEEYFAPLDDFGEPNAGCTGIKYRNLDTNEWEYL